MRLSPPRGFTYPVSQTAGKQSMPLSSHFAGQLTPELLQSLKDLDQSGLDRKTLLTLRQVLVGLRMENSQKLGFKDPFRCPRPLQTDTYTVSGGRIVARDAKDYSAYHCYFRRAPQWMKPINEAIVELGGKSLGERFVFAGLSDILVDLFQEPITRQEVDEVEGFLRKARKGKNYTLDARNIRKEPDGYLTYTGAYDKTCGIQRGTFELFALTSFLNHPNAERTFETATSPLGQPIENLVLTMPYGQPQEWDRTVWDRVVDEYKGMIPVRIEAPPEGSVTFPGEPVMQIQAGDGMGEMAAYFEPRLLQVWSASEAATLSRYWVEYNKALINYCTNEPLNDRQLTEWAQRLIMDFGDRSSKTAEESSFLGKARLLALWTTSTMSGLYRAYLANDRNPAGDCSMYSLAHRIVQSYEKEGDAYKALFRFAIQGREGGIGSFVADCYDFRRAVVKDLVPLAHEALKEGGTVFARPDSGEPFEEILFVLQEAEKAGLATTVTARDGRQLKGMTSLKVAQADGMDFETVVDINKKLIAAGYSPAHCVVYGVGGWFADVISRSSMSAAMKLAAVGKDQTPHLDITRPATGQGEPEVQATPNIPPNRPVKKFAPGSPGKQSIPGVVKVVRQAGEPSVRQAYEPGESTWVPYYDATDKEELRGIVYDEVFSKAQKRTLYQFTKIPVPPKLVSAETDRISGALEALYLKSTPSASEPNPSLM